MDQPEESPRFRITRRVEPGDLDEMEHVNNAVYLRWVQDVAVAHWREIAPASAQSGTLWVVVRHEIDYKAPALDKDELHVETWVGEATRITFERHTEIYRANDRQLLMKARTLWCPIDAQTKRPKRVDPEIRARFSNGSV